METDWIGSWQSLALLSGIGLWSGLLVILYFSRRRGPFNPLVPSALWWVLSAISFSAVILESRMWQRSLGAMIFLAGVWLALAIVTFLLMSRKSRA